ncbi:MAG: ionic transporter y4hA [Alcaligenaceae bacterium]
MIPYPETLWQIVLMAILLIAAVINAVHQAEVIAHKTGEPLGTLVLAVSVTIIEVALIVSIMLSAGANGALIARDSVFAAIMIVMNGVIGASIFLGGLRHRVLLFRVEGTNSSLAVLIALAVLTLVMPNFTTSTSGPTFSNSQLVLAGVLSLVLYGTFIFVQTVRHRDYFLPEQESEQANPQSHAPAPSNAKTAISGVLLLISLVAVVLLAKALSPSIESAIDKMGAPRSVVGIAIALLVLLPEGVAAARAAMTNRLQTSLNLSLGSALASIGLTIPAVAFVSIVFDMPISLGVDVLGMTFLALTFLLSILTIAIGRATVLQGVVHLVVFAAYLFLSLVP